MGNTSYLRTNLLKARWQWLPIALLAVWVATIPSATRGEGDQPEANSQQQYKLVWSDEFDEDGPPSAENWNYERGFVRNEELQWYRPDNAVCKDGLLVIEARRESFANPNYEPNARQWKRNRKSAEYTSASVTTRGLHGWKFARIEVRARIDARAGLWPAIWTLGESGPWPACGEVDIMEYYQGHLLANACWPSDTRWKPVWDEAKIPLSEFKDSDPDWPTKFHIWRMDWNSDRIELFIDERRLNTIDLNKVELREGQTLHPFRQPHYLLLNLAVGGTQGGDPAGTRFPSKYEIDYVRVYQQ